jgi:CO dehydrogenase/acetyl-CoA synthase delta subunit
VGVNEGVHYFQSQQRELTIRHAKETEKEMKKRLDVQKAEYEEAIKRHISFIDQVTLGHHPDMTEAF